MKKLTRTEIKNLGGRITNMGAVEHEHAKDLSIEDLEHIVYEGRAETCDGCIVEPDGKCPHGYRSPLLVLGLI